MRADNGGQGRTAAWSAAPVRETVGAMPALGRSGTRQTDYARAIREVVTPTEVRAIAREMTAVALGKDPTTGLAMQYDLADRRACADLVLVHTRGRPGTASPVIDPLDLPPVRDAASALEAYALIMRELGAGRITGDSAKLYASLVGDAAKIALANRTVSLLASGGAPTFVFSDELPMDEQLEKHTEFVRDALLARMSTTPAAPAEN